ncbi:hypothetical protein FJZ18_00020 [Candidatus Pacearchaeota archaeon]|nr:hypothetical protein [Candidatus Pacearchaeota archaeon]
MTKKYILTGGPGSGKSCIVLELERRGEYIIREAAEDVIRLEQAKGNPSPWKSPDFQKKILNLQMQREERVPKNLERIFIDRGILDGLAYIQPETEISREIQRQTRAYTGVFLVENLGFVKNNEIRAENHDAAMQIECKLKEVYIMAGYKIVHIPATDVNKRTDMILRYIQGEISK